MTDRKGGEHHRYYSKRAMQERSAAERSYDTSVKRIHLDLAGRYESLASEEIASIPAHSPAI